MGVKFYFLPVVMFQKGTDLKFCWHNEFRSLDSYEHVDPAEDQDGQDDGEVTDEFPHLCGRTDMNVLC